jgi:hypothetical protein
VSQPVRSPLGTDNRVAELDGPIGWVTFHKCPPQRRVAGTCRKPCRRSGFRLDFVQGRTAFMEKRRPVFRGT